MCNTNLVRPALKDRAAAAPINSLSAPQVLSGAVLLCNLDRSSHHDINLRIHSQAKEIDFPEIFPPFSHSRSRSSCWRAVQSVLPFAVTAVGIKQQFLHCWKAFVLSEG